MGRGFDRGGSRRDRAKAKRKSELQRLRAADADKEARDYMKSVKERNKGRVVSTIDAVREAPKPKPSWLRRIVNWLFK